MAGGCQSSEEKEEEEGDSPPSKKMKEGKEVELPPHPPPSQKGWKRKNSREGRTNVRSSARLSKKGGNFRKKKYLKRWELEVACVGDLL